MNPVVELIGIDSSVLNGIVEYFLIINGWVFFGRILRKLQPHNHATTLGGKCGSRVVGRSLVTGFVWVDKLLAFFFCAESWGGATMFSASSYMSPDFPFSFGKISAGIGRAMLSCSRGMRP